MSNAADPAGSPRPIIDVAVQRDDETKTRLNRAVTVSEFESAEAFVREATKRLIDETLDDGGELECPHDDCDRTFPTRAKRRGHLGSSEHALDVPDGEFWCGHCGYGPTNWRGINAHHGSSDHEGKPIRLESEPDQGELIDPDDRPDHKDPELLAELYEEHDSNYTAMWRAHDFEVSPGRVRHYLVEFGIHEVTPQESTDGDGPQYRDPEWLKPRYEAADGNISEMHRQIERNDDVDVAYTTLVNTLKKVGIHDPQRDRQATESGDDNESDTDDPADDPVVGTDEPAIDDDGDSDAGDDQQAVKNETDNTDTQDDARDDREGDTDSADGDETEENDPRQAVVTVDDPEAAETVADLATPGWLTEASFHVALEMSDTAAEFADNLGWGDPDELRVMARVIGEADALGGGGDA